MSKIVGRPTEGKMQERKLVDEMLTNRGESAGKLLVDLPTEEKVRARLLVDIMLTNRGESAGKLLVDVFGQFFEFGSIF